MNLTATIKFKGHVVSDVQPEKTAGMFTYKIKMPMTGLRAHFLRNFKSKNGKNTMKEHWCCFLFFFVCLFVFFVFIQSFMYKL